MSSISSLTLYAAVGITTSQTLYFVNTYQVEVAIDGVLQSRSSNGKLQSLALSRLGQQTMNQTTRERVATTYAIDDRIDLVTL